MKYLFRKHLPVSLASSSLYEDYRILNRSLISFRDITKWKFRTKLMKVRMISEYWSRLGQFPLKQKCKNPKIKMPFQCCKRALIHDSL